jgi:hypothetical protein
VLNFSAKIVPSTTREWPDGSTFTPSSTSSSSSSPLTTSDDSTW